MSEQQPSGGNRPQNSGPNNNSRRHHNQRRRPQGQGHNQGPNQGPGQGGNRERVQGGQQAQATGGQQSPGPGAGTSQRRRRPHHNRPRNPNNPNSSQQNPQSQGINIERVYEKYLNLLDQHLVARRKYHDLFFRADPAQKNKLERNFYNTLNDVRDFESKLDPVARELFEKRNNGLRPDNIYTTNHDLPVVGENPPPETEWSDPHFLQSQQLANYDEDKEESMGTLDDYLRYKNLL